MCRMVFCLKALVIVALLAGCRMCAHPYDYAGPVFRHGCGYGMQPGARMGSIFEGAHPEMPVEESAPEESVPQEAINPPYSPQGGIVGSPRVISVTDRAVTETIPQVVEKSKDEQGYIAVEAEPEVPATLPSRGWTAKRPPGSPVR